MIKEDYGAGYKYAFEKVGFVLRLWPPGIVSEEEAVKETKRDAKAGKWWIKDSLINEYKNKKSRTKTSAYKYAVEGIAQSRGNVGFEQRQYEEAPAKDGPGEHEADEHDTNRQKYKQTLKKYMPGYEPSNLGRDNSYGAYQGTDE